MSTPAGVSGEASPAGSVAGGRRGLCLFDLDDTLLPIDSDHAWGEFVIRPGASCGYCDFKTLCRKSHRPSVLRAEEADDATATEEAAD